jgi:glycine oxidase
VHSTYDVIVVGGGAIGAACARELAAPGRTVLVIEAGGDTGQAWRAAAGMLAPQIEADGGDPMFSLAVAARDHYQRLAAELRDAVGVDLNLWQEGIARVAGTEGEAEALRAKVEWQKGQGLPCDWLDAEAVGRRWPWLGAMTGALWAPRDGALDPEKLVGALLADAERRGAVRVDDRALSVRQSGGKAIGVQGEKSSYSAGSVVVAAGAWSGLLEGLPRPLPVRPVRGQMAALPWPSSIPRAIVYHKDCYLLARGGEAVIGSTMEEAGFRAEVTPEGLGRIFGAVMVLCPSLFRAKVRRTWAGLRPVTPDGLPIVGEDPLMEGLWYATGHGRNGILLAGITGVLVRQLIDDERPAFDLRAFAADRF